MQLLKKSVPLNRNTYYSGIKKSIFKFKNPPQSHIDFFEFDQ